MSHALLATILIVIDGHTGHWCTLDWIIERVGAPQSMVLQHCVSLAESCQIRTRDIDCAPQFGIEVTDSSPVVDVGPEKLNELAMASFADY